MRACPLKKSEVEIIQALANGRQLKQIARETGAPISTIHSSMQRVRERIGAGDTTASLVAHAMRKGWIQ
ncbi:response regulator transcription factor [Rhizobium sp. RMa-01]|uniref:helix-turn-helix transcriptional regulator n=1 Tax=unclassified Rhizobium TaxID=2613769 RepID=UPI0008D905DC|nr:MULTISPECIES: LuxR C-terminal-related transcriptional regulator [unclassified Rhizobium]OHV24921.1 hypothetical protein BBJ66_22520 [Rhizobium sp. RSm-3]RVU08371.1 response regulator transcription factor [Rhizobium sp. RMa-01]